VKLKDKKIEILKTVRVKDADGFGSDTLTPIAPPLWAYFRHLSGNEIHANDAAFPVEQVLFTVNYRPDVTTANVVRYRGILFDVTRVDTFEGYKADITLYCKLRGQ